jgi:hypothetical protein
MWAVSTPYLESFIPRFKLCAGNTKRWHPELKVWLVDDAHISDVKRIIKEQWGDFDFIDKAPERPTAAPSGAWESFVRALGYEVANMAYKRAIALAHPDVGGSTERAASLNAAWQEIRFQLKREV